MTPANAALLARVRTAYGDPGIATLACTAHEPRWLCVHSERDGRLAVVGDMWIQQTEEAALLDALRLAPDPIEDPAT